MKPRNWSGDPPCVVLERAGASARYLANQPRIAIAVYSIIAIIITAMIFFASEFNKRSFAMSNTDISTTGPSATVDIKSAWLSKINWAQAVGVAASILAVVTAGKYNVPAEQQLVIVGVIQGIQSVATWVIKTWFTPTVTPASVAAPSK